MLSSIAPVAFFLAAPASNPDIELYDYTVKEGDTCARIAKQEFEQLMLGTS